MGALRDRVVLARKTSRKVFRHDFAKFHAEVSGFLAPAKYYKLRKSRAKPKFPVAPKTDIVSLGLFTRLYLAHPGRFLSHKAIEVFKEHPRKVDLLTLTK